VVGSRRRALRSGHFRLRGGSLVGIAGVLFLVAPSAAWATPAAWSIVPSPNASTGVNHLNGVSCVSARSCKAVGTYDNRTLIETWSGTSWNIQASPNEGGSGFLNAVSCVSGTSCTAVGYYSGDASVDQTLVESLSGHTWTIVPSPDVPGPNGAQQRNVLTGVSCVSATSCKAVGYFGPSSSVTLIESWDGTSWTIQASPNKGTAANLSGVSCTAAACEAVGYYRNSVGVARTMVESWNGSIWSVTPSPNRGTDSNQLSSVSCVSDSSCMAVGSYNAGFATLAESWNGQTWSTVSSANGGAETNELNGVSCISATSCDAVGVYISGGSGWPLEGGPERQPWQRHAAGSLVRRSGTPLHGSGVLPGWQRCLEHPRRVQLNTQPALYPQPPCTPSLRSLCQTPW
jgi:hypothetical protein